MYSPGLAPGRTSIRISMRISSSLTTGLHLLDDCVVCFFSGLFELGLVLFDGVLGHIFKDGLDAESPARLRGHDQGVGLALTDAMLRDVFLNVALVVVLVARIIKPPAARCL